MHYSLNAVCRCLVLRMKRSVCALLACLRDYVRVTVTAWYMYAMKHYMTAAA